MTSSALLEVRNASMRFGAKGRFPFGAKRVVRAVDDVSLILNEGETLGLVGESGSGKSTLARMVTRLVEPSGGTFLFRGADLRAMRIADVRAMRRQIQMVFQDPYGSLDPRMTIRQLLAEPLTVHGASASEIGPRVRAVMERVGLNVAQLDRYPHQFSGGQRQRIGIARAIILDPSLLILDEPVSALDVSVQAQILNLIGDLQRERRLAMLFIAHDLSVVRHVSHRIAVLYLGRIVESGPRDAIFGQTRHPYTASLLSAVPIPDPVAARAQRPVIPIGEIGSAMDLPSGCRFHPRCPRARAVAREDGVRTRGVGQEQLPVACVESDPELAARGPGHLVACHYPAEPATIH